MAQRDSEFWTKARRARDVLSARFAHHPDVSSIDIGYAPDRVGETEEIVLRIHVKERWTTADPETRVAFPEQVEGIRVIVVKRESRFEMNGPAAGGESNHLA